MEIFSQHSFLEFMNAVYEVKQDLSNWTLAEMHVADNSVCNVLIITKKLQMNFVEQNLDGKIFICNKNLVIILINAKYEDVQKLPEGVLACPGGKDCCKATLFEGSLEAIENIQNKLKDVKDQLVPIKLCPIRKERKENVIIVVDDDVFIRTIVSKALAPYAKVIGIDKGSDVIDAYLQHLPDIIFLDIHLPDVSGTELLQQILNFDRDAYVVMVSADSNRNNVIDTNRVGAKGFIAKPFTAGKLLYFLEKCPTVDI